jgi:iron complex outermembrane receptor protein
MRTRFSLARTALMAGVGFVSVASSGAALGQVSEKSAGADASTPPRNEADAAGEDPNAIVVTARLRQERLIDVPVSANVMNALTLERYGTNDLQGAVAQLPQLNIQSTNAGPGAVITLRGIGTSGSDTGVEQSVTVNIVGVPISRGRIVKLALFDVDSIEVLKGPQSLYFGKNAPAGVIIVNSAQPTDDLSGYVKAGYEFRAREFNVEGAVSLPISDSLKVRIAGRVSDMSGGYVKNIGGPLSGPTYQQPAFIAAGLTLPGSPYKSYPGSKTYVGRVVVKFEPSTSFNATITGFAGKYEDRAPNGQYVTWSCGEGQTQTMTSNLVGGGFFLDPYSPCNGRQAKRRANAFGVAPQAVAASFREVDSNKTFNKVPIYLGALTMNYNMTDAVTLTSVTGYYRYDAEYFSDNSYSALAMAPGYQSDFFRQWTQEFRIGTDFDGPLNFTGGVFYGSSRRRYINEAFIAYIGPDPVTGQWSMYQNHDRYTDKTRSAFGEVRWKISDAVELSGGARFTSEKITGRLEQVYRRFVAGLSPGQVVQGGFTDKNWSPQVTLSWKPSEDVLVYAAYKTGFKAGGFSSPAILPATATAANQSFKAETVEGYEAGVKFSALGGDLSGDATIYHYKYQDLQAPSFNAAVTAYFIQNAGSASQDGAEANLRYKVSQQLTVRGSVSYNDSRFIKFANSQCWAFQTAAEGCVGGVQNLGGRTLALAPKWVALAGANFQTELSDDLEFAASIDGKYSTGYYLGATLNPFSRQGEYATIDASARLMRDGWELALIGRNLTNAYYATFAQDKALGPRGQTMAALAPPRTVEVQVRKRF